MNILKQENYKSNYMKQHTEQTRINPQPAWVGLIRIALGFLLVWKGLLFIQDTGVIQSVIERAGVTEVSTLATVLAAVIGIVTLLSGVFISVGFFTRAVA